MTTLKADIVLSPEDHSTREEFRFSISCPQCGKMVHSKPVRFSKAGVIPSTDGKSEIFRVLYEREKTQAYELALKSIAGHLSLCPICGMMVCDNCFLVCEDIDMCAACARRLNEAGEPVL